MALIMEANYSKKLGLPGYSSHQFMVTVRMELGDMNQVAAESSRLYALLQSSVDHEIQKTGFLPQGQSIPIHNGNGNGNAQAKPSNGSNGSNERWACSEKQQSLILQVVADANLEKGYVEQLAMERFGKGVKALNKLEASGLIDELLEKHGSKGPNGGNGGRGGNGNNRFHQYQKAGAK